MPGQTGEIEGESPGRTGRPSTSRLASAERAMAGVMQAIEDVLCTPDMKQRLLTRGDIVYHGQLIDDADHSNCCDYLATMERLHDLPVSIIRGGDFPSFGPARFRQLIDEYLGGKGKPGCHHLARSHNSL